MPRYYYESDLQLVSPAEEPYALDSGSSFALGFVVGGLILGGLIYSQTGRNLAKATVQRASKETKALAESATRRLNK